MSADDDEPIMVKVTIQPHDSELWAELQRLPKRFRAARLSTYIAVGHAVSNNMASGIGGDGAAVQASGSPRSQAGTAATDNASAPGRGRNRSRHAKSQSGSKPGVGDPAKVLEVPHDFFSAAISGLSEVSLS